MIIVFKVYAESKIKAKVEGHCSNTSIIYRFYRLKINFMRSHDLLSVYDLHFKSCLKFIIEDLHANRNSIFRFAWDNGR